MKGLWSRNVSWPDKSNEENRRIECRSKQLSKQINLDKKKDKKGIKGYWSRIVNWHDKVNNELNEEVNSRVNR